MEDIGTLEEAECSFLAVSTIHLNIKFYSTIHLISTSFDYFYNETKIFYE